MYGDALHRLDGIMTWKHWIMRFCDSEIENLRALTRQHFDVLATIRNSVAYFMRACFSFLLLFSLFVLHYLCLFCFLLHWLIRLFFSLFIYCILFVHIEVQYFFFLFCCDGKFFNDFPVKYMFIKKAEINCILLWCTTS